MIRPSLTLPKIISALIMLTVVAVVGVGLAKYWLIKEVKCWQKGQEITTVCQQLEPLKGKSIFFTNLDQSLLYSQVLKNEQGQAFQVVSYRKQLPSTLIVEFEKQNPSYRLKVDEQIYLANFHNFLAADDQQFAWLPVIELDQSYYSLVNYPQIDANLNQKLISLVETGQDYELELERALIKQEQSFLVINNWQFRFEFQSVQWRQLLARIKVILSAFEADDFNVADPVIDMRFDLPVVQTGQQPSALEINAEASVSGQILDSVSESEEQVGQATGSAQSTQEN